MDAITIGAEVGHDRRLVDALPPEIPIGRVKPVIGPIEESPLGARLRATHGEVRSRRHAVAKMLAERLLPPGTIPLTKSEHRSLIALSGSQTL